MKEASEKVSKETSPSIVMGPTGRQTHTTGDTHQTQAMHRTGKQAREILFSLAGAENNYHKEMR